jgi:hypothetical protein
VLRVIPSAGLHEQLPACGSYHAQQASAKQEQAAGLGHGGTWCNASVGKQYGLRDCIEWGAGEGWTPIRIDEQAVNRLVGTGAGGIGDAACKDEVKGVCSPGGHGD